MRGHLPAPDHGVMDPAPAPYMIRVNGHLGATVLSAFPALVPQHRGQPYRRRHPRGPGLSSGEPGGKLRSRSREKRRSHVT